MQTIYLDISNKGVSPTVYAKQGDVGRKFQVVLTDSGLPYIPVSGSAFSVWYSGASGEGNYTDIGDKSAFTINENKVIVEMISQMLSNHGDGVLSLALNDPNGNQISTWNIPYFCEHVPGADSEEAKNYYTAFSRAVENLPYPDSSLSVSGKAADAAATGAALAGKAPAGYGLGMAECAYPPNADANQISANGFWQCYVNCPDSANWYIYREAHIVGTYEHQSAIRVIDGQRAERTMAGGVWGEWEWVSPPMSPTTEYRTTERWKGKAVYTKLVHIGALPNAWLMGVDCKTTGATEVVTYNITTKRNDEASFTNTAMVDFVTGTYATIKDGNIEIGITTDRDASHLEAKLLVKYTKD